MYTQKYKQLRIVITLSRSSRRDTQLRPMADQIDGSKVLSSLRASYSKLDICISF